MQRTKRMTALGAMMLLCGAAWMGGCDSAADGESKPAASVEGAVADAKQAGQTAEQSDKAPQGNAAPGRYAERDDAADKVGHKEINLGDGSDPLAGLDSAPSRDEAPAEKAEAAGEAMPPPSSAMAPMGGQLAGKGAMPQSRGKRSAKKSTGRPHRRPMPKPIAKADSKPSTDGEGYDHIPENDFIAVADDPRSTFSIDVDTASFANVRRHIQDGALPPPEAVRVEEMINYFSYNYEAPIGSDPFTVNTEVSGTPWNEDSLLVSVGLQGQRIDQSEVAARNLVFLLDVSGSMNDPDKLPLLKAALGMLVDNMRDNDRVSIVVYAGASGVVLEPTMGNDKPRITEALQRLEAGGSTNGGEGIQLAYKMAKRNFVEGGINRVILATDGDFNVGVTNRTALMDLIEEKRKSGVFLSVLGFGTGNMQDSTMEQIADKGNGNYAYIDSKAEARKVLVEEAGGTLVTIAKDVKIQVEFNPAEVENYRLIGYENRKLAHADFNDDTKDAGEIGAGHSVTALYEVTPKGNPGKRTTDKLKYQDDSKPSAAAASGELMTVKVRYKKPDGNKSKLISTPITGDDRGLRNTSKDYRFAAAVAEFGMLLRKSKHKGSADYDHVLKLAGEALGSDPHGHRKAFITLVKQAKKLAGNDAGALARGRE